MTWSTGGSLRWATAPREFTQVLGLEDLDRDGRFEVYVAGRNVGPVAYDTLTGDMLWDAELPVEQFLGDVLPIDADGDGLLELLVSEWGGPTAGRATARLVDFPEGVGGPTVVTEFQTSAHGYWFGLGVDVGELAGDGRSYLVAASNDRIIAYDIITGQAAFTSPPLGDFPFGKTKLNVIDVDGDGRDEIVASSNNTGSAWPASKRLMLLEVEAGELVLRWELRADAARGEHRFIRDNVATLRSGDVPSIVTSIFDPSLSRWQTLIIPGDSGSGAPTVTVDDRVLLALDDPDGDGISDLLMLDTPGLGVPSFGTIHGFELQPDDTLRSRWVASDAIIATAPTPWRSSSAAPLHDSRSLLLRLDSDADGRADAVGYVDGVTDVFRPPAGVGVSDVRLPTAPGLPDHFWVSMTDGHIGRADAGLSLTNDSDGDGLADLRVGNYIAPQVATARGASGMLLATVDPSGTPVAYAPSLGSEPIWRARLSAAAPRPTLTWLPGSPPLLVYPARERDGTLSLVTLEGDTGAEQAHVSLGASISTIVLNDLLPLRRADGTVRSVVVGLLDRRSGAITYTAIETASGATTILDLGRQLRSGEYPATAHDVDDDGVEDALLIQIAQLRAASGVTGSEIATHANPRFGGMMSYVDLDGDGTLDVLHQGGAFGINATSPGFGARRLSGDLTAEVWSFDQDKRHQAAALAPALTGAFHLGLTRQREAWFGALDADGILLGGWVPAGGERYADEVAARSAGQEPGIATAAVGVAAVTPGRSASFVFGSSDGYLYSARAEDGSFAWSLPFRTALTTPIASDVVGDAASEIILAAGDGNIYIVGPARLEPPAEVFDNDGETLAGTASADLDELPRSSRVGADWPAVPGATGYEYQLLREDDLVVVPWVDVGNQTHAFVDALSLDVGPLYFSLVRAYDRAGEVRVSPEARSDGFVIVDDEGPSVVLNATPELFWRPGTGEPAATHVQMITRDSIGLREFRISVQRADAAGVRFALASGPAAGVERTVEVSWMGLDDSGAAVPAGLYTVVGEATDLDGRTAEATVAVTVCTADAPDSLGCGPAADAGTSDGGTPGTLAGGGGCGCRLASPGTPRTPIVLVFIGALGWILTRRRPR